MTSLSEELAAKLEFASPQQEAYLSLVVTVDRLYRQHSGFMADYGISPKQYNILRILRGGDKAGLPIMDVGRRMVEKSPDVSRIINRLIDLRLVSRRRQRSDRRVVRVSISPKGLKLLERMEGPVQRQVDSMLAGLTGGELDTLMALLDRVRDSLYDSSS